MKKRQKEALLEILGQPVQWDYSMKRCTSFSVGGAADAVVKVENHKELQQLLCFLKKEGIDWRVIGRGTNILVRDEGFAGVIILLTGDFEKIVQKSSTSASTIHLQVGCGCGLGRLGRYCLVNDLAGLEFTAGIPGSIGGAVLMNAGAWGSDMASVIKSVSLITCNGAEQLGQEKLDFVYRNWPGFETYKGRAVLTEAVIELKRGEAVSIKAECRRLLNKRKQNQPHHYANAGSFFKNPPGDSAGRLIEACGLKGKKVGDAMVSRQHANFLVNRGEATAKDILILMETVQEKVAKDSGVDLHPEIHII